jgi:hypothetical protein
LNEGIRKLFQLPPTSAETVCANLEFFRKLNIVTSALYDQDAGGKHKRKITKFFNRIATMNTNRVIAAHADVELNGNDGVVFNWIVAKTGLERTSPTWTEKDCSKMFAEMDAIRKDLHILAQTIAPYHPRMDFSDPRNSIYIAVS